jgi:tRNA-2-methylthio-N6-dimethylallyladenosine synthase
MPQKNKFFIETFGCQMNVHDSERIAGVLSQEGYSPAESRKDADFIIFNTCSVRQKAEQKFFSELGRIKSLKKRNPDLKIAVAGCIARQQGEKVIKRSPHVDFVFGPQNIHKINDFLHGDPACTANEDNPEIALTDLPVLRSSEGRAWVTVMYGCDNFCSYCIVPYTRGRERSRPSENIISEIKGIAGQGFKEVTLLGQNVNSYSSNVDFPDLLKEVNAVEGIERIRFVTSHPKDFSGKLMQAMAELEKVCEHMHLPLQSGSGRVLSLMDRGYSYDDYRMKIDRLRDIMPEIAITSDIIAGFPGETDDDHKDTVKALKEIGFDGIFAFKYSPRPGTKAALMEDGLEDIIKSERLAEILEVQDGITGRINKGYENTVQEILVEGVSVTDTAALTGRTRTNKIVNFSGISCDKNSIVNVRIAESKKYSLRGAPL